MIALSIPSCSVSIRCDDRDVWHWLGVKYVFFAASVVWLLMEIISGLTSKFNIEEKQNPSDEGRYSMTGSRLSLSDRKQRAEPQKESNIICMCNNDGNLNYKYKLFI